MKAGATEDQSMVCTLFVPTSVRLNVTGAELHCDDSQPA